MPSNYQENALYFTLFNITHKENPAQISVFNFSSVKRDYIMSGRKKKNSLGTFLEKRKGKKSDAYNEPSKSLQQ